MNEALAAVLVAVVASIVIVLLAWFGGKLIVAFLRRLAHHTESSYDGGLVEAIGPQVSWLIAAAGFALAAIWLPVLGEAGRWLFEQATFFLLVLAAAVGISRWFDFSLDSYGACPAPIRIATCHRAATLNRTSGLVTLTALDWGRAPGSARRSRRP